VPFIPGTEKENSMKNTVRIALAMIAALAGTMLHARAGAQEAAKPAHRKSAPEKKTESPPVTPFCAFVQRVAAGAAEEFNSFKGEQDTVLPVKPGEKPTMFKGTLSPHSDTKCTLYLRDGKEDEIQPHYACMLGPSRTLEDSKPVYENAAAELRACFPNGKISEQRTGDESKREESWELKLQQPGFEVKLGLLDYGLLAGLISREPSGKPGVLVDLVVTDTALAPEEPKTAAAKEMSATLPLCRFVEKVLAARPTEYATIRSLRADAATGVYEGKLQPDAQSTCRVYPPVRGGGTHMFYSCEVRRAKTMEEIKPEYDRMKTELPACYSNLRFKEDIMKNDSGQTDTRDEIWFFTGKSSRYLITMEAQDEGWRLKSEPEKVDAKTKEAPVSLVLQIKSPE
jgi:hypothetical protein